MLTPRQALLLGKVVDGFARTGQPVGSKTLAADPEVGIDFARMVHGAQEFTWHEPVVAGDEITTEAELAETAERAGLKYFTFTSRSVNQRGELVCQGRWTNIVR